ncbi:MAG: glucoamylase family protein, partial [Gemmatimonadales bacterium]
ARAPRRTPLLARLEATHRIIEDALERLSAAADEDVDVGPAGVWLLDNGFLVEEHISEVRDSLPRGYYRELPELAAGPLAGYPRVYELAITLISHSEGRIDLENVDLFVAAFQEVAPLSIGELWSIPAMLRLGLLESVRRMTIRTVRRLDELEAADEWSARILSSSEQGAEVLREALDEFVADPPERTPVFVSRFLQQLRPSRALFPPLVWLEHWIAEDGLTADDAAAQAAQRLAHTQIMMAHSLTSLRAIARIDWNSLVERRSAMEAVLRAEPSAFYPRMTFATRDHYRHVVERIAKRAGLTEVDVARRAVELGAAAGRADPADLRRTHVGYWLADEGRAVLDRDTGYRPTTREAAYRWMLAHPNVVFVGGIAAGTAVALAAVLGLAGAEARAAWPLVLLFALLPAADIAVNVVNQLVTAFLPPRLLPKLDLNVPGGVPAEYRTAVVVPTLFPSVAAVHEALEHLEVQFLANREAHLHFALLSDFVDAPAETAPGDDEIVAAAAAGVRELNARYAPDTGDAFYLLHRPRRWNPQQGVWMGWERKRGKLAEFNRFVRGGAPGAFSVVVGDVAPLRQVRYVITLDADTVLPPDAAPLLVGALTHPLNRAEYDSTRGRVVRGYGILQPRVGVTLPSAHGSRFAAIHSGHPGVDPYTTAVSDVYQDLYGEGSFTGKGIYDVDAFEEATHGRFPENTLLSHDLIEGNYARAGLATDITVYDEYPARYLTYARRKHRWIRGDWQLLGWLTPRVPGPDGPERNRLSLLSRWKILDNLRRSTLELAQMAFLVAGWTLLPGSPLRWTLLGLGAVAAPWIVAFLLALLRPPLDKSWRAYYAVVARDAVTSVQQVALAIAVLPHQAWVSLDAIARTLWRLFVSRRWLLEWQAAQQTERTLAGTAWNAWRMMSPGLALAASVGLLVVAIAVLRPVLGGDAVDSTRHLRQLAIAVGPLLLLWLAAPAVAHALDAPPRQEGRKLSAEGREEALRYARLHWEFYQRFVTADTHWLAPDNFQEDPAPVVAMRTSPTNIGLQLLATVSAYDLGFIPAGEMTRRLEEAFRTLERLPRFKGHFYNWYDLNDLRILEPAYVSTVDSGNLAGHLIAVRQACRAIAVAVAGADGTDLAARLGAIAERAQAYAVEMDFDFLFDRARRLFAIGYQQAAHSLDGSYYDLLASEARLASFVAVAKKDVPVDHWFRLARTLTASARDPALVSWSGSVFEYLMPLLVMRSYPFTLLHQTYRGAIRRQVAYGARHGVPWGVSESAYNRRDRHLTYQYRAFGVPDLALKRGLGRDLVIAPYASALAVMVDPEPALANLAALEQRGALGPYGFRDALDYTRPTPGQRFSVVGTYMAHHVGMTLVALTNALAAGVWQRRFHADPMVRSAELLLHERVPRRLVLQEPQVTRAEEALPDPELERPAVREVEDPDTAEPRVALLGRLPYTILVSHAGSGYSRYEDRAVTRWRADGTSDASGQFCYVKDVGSGRVWSVAHQPVGAPADWYRALLATDRVTFHRADGPIETRTEIAVVPQDAAEVRRVTVTNNGAEVSEVELTSYGEVVLATHDADRAHPAFASLFVQTEWHEWCTALTAVRRPRAAHEPKLWCVHVVDTCREQVGPVSWETDRARFLGRGRAPRDPRALEADGPLDGRAGAVIDPILALRTRVRLAPGQSASVAFTTLVAATAERAFELAGRYHDPHAAQRALDLAWTTTQVELRELEISPADAAAFQHLAGHLVYPGPEHRAPAEELSRNHGSQERLWGTGISGDMPILLATIDAEEGLPTLRQLLIAHQYWRRRGLAVDLVILNERPATYLQELADRIAVAIHAVGEAGVLDRPGGVFVRRRDLMHPEDLLMLRASARVHIACDGRSLGRILEGREAALAAAQE